MAFTLVQHAATENLATTSLTVTLPGAVTVGNMLTLLVETSDNPANLGGTGLSGMSLRMQNDDTTTRGNRHYEMIATATTSAFQVTIVSSQYLALCMAEWSGNDASGSEFDAAGTSSAWATV